MSDDPTLGIGIQVGGSYRLEKLLGKGSMGTVWAARNVHTTRTFAVKILLNEHLKDPTHVKRFLNEARVSAKLHHPSIIEVYDIGVVEELSGAPYMVMELLRGEDLEQLLERKKTIEIWQVAPALLQAASALQVAHEAGIVHRDLKPSNIFLHRTREEKVVAKVLDFGVARSDESMGLGLTQAGSLVGTPLYMSPEQATGAAVDQRADVWALGVILYECLSGTFPFLESTFADTLVAISEKPIRPLADAVKGVPLGISKLVEDCLAKDPAERVPSAKAFAERLSAALADLEEDEPAPYSTVISDSSRQWEGEVTEVMAKEQLPTAKLEDLVHTQESRPDKGRDEWGAWMARALVTAQTDDVPDADGRTSTPIRLASERTEAVIREVEDATEGSLSETADAIRAAREQIQRGSLPPPAPRPSADVAAPSAWSDRWPVVVGLLAVSALLLWLFLK